MLAKHEVQFIEDRQMPDGVDWLMLEVDGDVHCVVRRSKVEPCVLEDAWAGYRRLADVS